MKERFFLILALCDGDNRAIWCLFSWIWSFFSQNLRIFAFSANMGFDFHGILYVSPFFFAFMNAFDAKFCCCEGLGCEFSARTWCKVTIHGRICDAWRKIEWVLRILLLNFEDGRFFCCDRLLYHPHNGKIWVCFAANILRGLFMHRILRFLHILFVKRITLPDSTGWNRSFLKNQKSGTGLFSFYIVKNTNFYEVCLFTYISCFCGWYFPFDICLSSVKGSLKRVWQTP